MNEKIVLIDDDPTVQEVVRGYLAKAGFRVFVAGSGHDGLGIAERTKPALEVESDPGAGACFRVRLPGDRWTPPATIRASL